MSDLQLAQSHGNRNLAPRSAWVYARNRGTSHMISFLLRAYPDPHNAVACGVLLRENSRAYPWFVLALLSSSRLHSTDCQGPDCETPLTVVREDVLKVRFPCFREESRK